MSMPDKAYHVIIRKDTETVHVSCIGMECLDSNIAGEYSSLHELPKWMQGRIAVLSLTNNNKPRDWWAHVPDVGKRLRENEYWIFDQ